MTTFFNFTVSCYLEEMTSSVGTLQQYQDNLLSEMAGFAGCEIIRRYIFAYSTSYWVTNPMQFAWKKFEKSVIANLRLCLSLRFLNILTYSFTFVFFNLHGLFVVAVGWLELPPWRTSTAPTVDRMPWGPGPACWWARTTSSQWTNSRSSPLCWFRQPHHFTSFPYCFIFVLHILLH